MGKIVAVANQKGGVGKTTTATNLSALLGSLRQRVLLVDLDPQGNATSGLGLRAGDRSIYEALLGQAPLSECLTASPWEGLTVAPGDIRLAGAEVELVNLPQREHRLRRLLSAVREAYDFILIDCPPSLGLLTINALSAADSVLIPIQCEYYALEGLSSLVSTIRRVQGSFNPSLAVEGILLTMMDGRTNLSTQVAEQVKAHFRGQVYGVTIPRSVRLGEAPSHGEPIHVYDPRSAGALAYRVLAAEFLTRNGKRIPKDAAGKAPKPSTRKK
ncbi:MAG: ParA family protein [Clostridia bacterium]|nr:ParA family protein [Clostridia bacterium]